MFKSRTFNFVSAVLFFVVAIAMIVAAAWIYDHADDLTATAPPPVTQPRSAPTTAQRQAPPAPTTTAPRTQPQTAETKSAQRTSSQDRSWGKQLSTWLNKTFGLRLIKEETKSMLSLLCALIGTIFSFRTYRLSRRRTQLLEDSLKSRSS